MVTTEDQHQEQLEGLVVGEGDQKIMVHQVEVEGTLGEAAVYLGIKPEEEEAPTAVARIVPVRLEETPMKMALFKCVNGWAD